jgi:putative colanic acid biosynthesis acetyltransferase WcaF
MDDDACLGEQVDCYSVAKIKLGKRTTISQYSYLCAASHDYMTDEMRLVAAPITIGDHVWITADVFVAPGVTIADGVVVTARSSVFADLPAWVVASGNPAQCVRARVFEIVRDR